MNKVLVMFILVMVLLLVLMILLCVMCRNNMANSICCCCRRRNQVPDPLEREQQNLDLLYKVIQEKYEKNENIDISAVLLNRRVSVTKRDEVKEHLIDLMLNRMRRTSYGEYAETGKV